MPKLISTYTVIQRPQEKTVYETDSYRDAIEEIRRRESADLNEGIYEPETYYIHIGKKEVDV